MNSHLKIYLLRYHDFSNQAVSVRYPSDESSKFPHFPPIEGDLMKIKQTNKRYHSFDNVPQPSNKYSNNNSLLSKKINNLRKPERASTTTTTTTTRAPRTKVTKSKVYNSLEWQTSFLSQHDFAVTRVHFYLDKKSISTKYKTCYKLKHIFNNTNPDKIYRGKVKE